MGMERRRHKRVPLDLLVQVRLGTSVGAEPAADISAGGMFLRTEKPRPLGSELFLQVLVDGSSKLEGMGRVVHVNPAGGTRPAGMGIEFVSLSDESQRWIDELVNARVAVPA